MKHILATAASAVITSAFMMGAASAYSPTQAVRVDATAKIAEFVITCPRDVTSETQDRCTTQLVLPVKDSFVSMPSFAAFKADFEKIPVVADPAAAPQG